MNHNNLGTKKYLLNMDEAQLLKFIDDTDKRLKKDVRNGFKDLFILLPATILVLLPVILTPGNIFLLGFSISATAILGVTHLYHSIKKDFSNNNIEFEKDINNGIEGIGSANDSDFYSKEFEIGLAKHNIEKKKNTIKHLKSN